MSCRAASNYLFSREFILSGILSVLQWVADMSGFLLGGASVAFAIAWVFCCTLPDGSGDPLAQCGLSEAHRLVKERDIVGASNQFGKVLATDGRRAEAFVGRASCRLSLGDLSGALEDVESASSIGWNPSELAILRAKALLGHGRDREALSSLNNAMSLAADHPGLRVFRGQLLTALGSLEQALADFRAASEIDPESEVAPMLYG